MTISALTDRLIVCCATVYVYLRHLRQVRVFRRVVGYFPIVGLPKRYNEKVLWRKVFDHNPKFVVFSDKLACKDFVAERCPQLPIPEVIWRGQSMADVPSSALGRPSFLKANHGWKFNKFLPATTDVADLPSKMADRWLRTAHGTLRLEWAYLQVQPELFLELAIGSGSNATLIDLSVHAVDGQPIIVEIEIGAKTADSKNGYFHPDGQRWPELERQDQVMGEQRLPANFEAPNCMPVVLRHAQALGRGVDYARYDFLIIENQIYAGEITVYPGAGLNSERTFSAYNAVLTPAWNLSLSWFVQTPQKGLREWYRRALARQLDALHQ